MKGKRLRMRAARLLAAVYVMYVVMSGMAIPGVDGSYKPLVKAKAAGSVTITNIKKLQDAKAVSNVSATPLTDKNVTYFTLNKHSNSPYIDGKYTYNIYSVKYNNQDYFYDPANDGDGTKTGLFYSDEKGKWGFVFPASGSSYEIQVQIAVEFTATTSNITINNENFESSAVVGKSEKISNEILGTKLDAQLAIQYYNYEGSENTKRGSCSSENEFGSSNLRFYCLNAETNHYTYHIQYGGSSFLYQGDINNPATLQIWKTASPEATAYRQPGTNRYIVAATTANPNPKIKFTQLVWPKKNGGIINAFNSINNGVNITFPDEGIYLPGVSEDEQYYGSATISFSGTGLETKTLAASLFWYGPSVSSFDELEAGTSKNIVDNLKDTNEDNADYAGNVIEVDSTKVTKDIPYSDDYVTIDYYGNVTAKKACGQKKYKLITETKYTAMTQNSDKSFGYEDASGNFSYTPTGVYGTQTWTVPLTITKITGSSTSTETTEAPTTAAPATYKATLSPDSSQTATIAADNYSAKKGESITIEAGQIVTVTPGPSIYGSTVTVDDSATQVINNNGTYTFTMPAKAITVTVTDITLSSISATITGAGATDSPYAFGTKTVAPTDTEIVDAFKKGNLSITGTLNNNTATTVTPSQATYSVKSNTPGTEKPDGNTITHSGTAVITVSYGGKSTTVNYYYTYTTTNQKTLQSISIAAKAGSTLSTDSAKPTVYETKSVLPSEADIKSQLGTITATYLDSLGNTSTETIANTETGVELKVTTSSDKVTPNADESYTHAYTSQITATYNGKTSNTVTFYYQYNNYSVTCSTVDENGQTNIPSNLQATVSPALDIAKGTTVTITAPEDTTLKYLKTKVSVIGASQKDYSNTVSNNTFTMPAEPVTVTVTYTKLSGYTVTPPTKTKLEAMPTKENLSTLLSGASLTPEYKSTKGAKVDLTSNLVTLGADKETFKDGVTTHTIPVTVVFNGITKENAFSFIYEEKHSYTASVEQTAGPVVQIKKGSAYTNSISGYYGDTITVRVPEETQEYAFPTVTVKSASGKTIKTINQPGETTFTLPAENVTVTASYQKLTELIVTPPDTSKGEYSQNTQEKDLPLGTIVAEYGSASQTKTITMTSGMYKIGERREDTTTDTEGNKTITATVDVTIHVEYGGIMKDVPFSYSYSYTVSKDSKAITIKEVSCGDEALENSGLVKVSQNIADPNSEIIITVKETPEYAFPSVSVKTVSGTSISSTLSDTEDEKTATFTMPNEDVEIVVDYKPLTKLTLQEPDKKEYDYYTKPEDLDLTGGFLTAAYGTSGTDVKTIALKTEAGVSNGCTVTCTEGTAKEENGVREIPVTVSITYGGKTVSYEYTYQEVRGYSVTLDKSTLPEDLVNKDKIRLSKTGGNYNDELTLSLPADTGDMYAFPVVTITRGNEVETWEPENGAYKTVITDDMTVSVSYCKLSKLELTLPTGGGYVGNSLSPVENLDTSKVKLELVYYNDKEEVGGRISVPASEYASFAYGEETESVTNGVCTHTVRVLVTANYKDLVEAEGSYSVWYRNYQVSAEDVDGNSLSVDKNRANAGETITISLTPGMDVQRITANDNSVGYELSEDRTKASIVLSEGMKSDKTGYAFVVAYQTIQKIKAPTEAVVVSDKIMTEEELSQALADLSSFDFGTASIKVSYDELEPNTEILLNSPSITKKLLQDKTTQKESADGTYIERTYVVQATVSGKSVEVPIIVKVEKKKADTSGDASGKGTGQQNPEGNTGGNPSLDTGKKDDGEKNPVVTATKPGKVTGVKVTAKKRKLTVTWKAADNATAYEIWVSTKKNGGYLKAATVKKSGSKKTYSYTVKKLDDSKLKKGKTYYVKVRAVNVKSKLAKKTITQTVKSKKNRRLYVTVKSVKNAVSYTVKASTKKKSGYKTIFKFDEIGKKKYTKYIKHQKRNTKYYIKVEVKVETGKRYEGSYSSVVKGKCK